MSEFILLLEDFIEEKGLETVKKELKELSTKLNETNKILYSYKPNIGEYYYFYDKEPILKKWENSDFDRNRYDGGNCFKTLELLEKNLENLKTCLKAWCAIKKEIENK